MPGFQEMVFPFGGGTNVQYAAQAAPAYAQMAGVIPQSMANLYGSASQGFTGYGQGLAGQSQAQASNYNAYAGALGNLAQSYGNQLSARYGANAMAAAAQQGAAGNIGSAALGAYGNLGGQAMQAWAQNQNAYNQALANMTSANQYATSQLGQSRNAALAGLGNSYSQAAAGLSPATLASDISLNFSDGGGGGYGGGGFAATGPDGGIGSGSYGVGGGGGGMNFTGTKTSRLGAIQGIVDQTYGGLGNVLSSINDDRYGGTLTSNYDKGLGTLNEQHASSRDTPSQMMNQGLRGLTSLGDQAYGNSNRGMDQFYANTQSDPRMYGTFAKLLSSGYGDSSGRVSGNAGSLNKAWGDNRSQFDATLQNVGNMFDAGSSRGGGLRSALEGALNEAANYAAVYPGMRDKNTGMPTSDTMRKANILSAMLAQYFPSGQSSTVMPKYA